MFKIGFDNEKYLQMQSDKIRERIGQFGGKLYLEFGGKLFDDYHASRVLPGFAPDSKVKMLLQMKDSAEIVIVISADAIEKNKRRGDLGITYDRMSCASSMPSVGSACMWAASASPITMPSQPPMPSRSAWRPWGSRSTATTLSPIIPPMSRSSSAMMALVRMNTSKPPARWW